MYLVINKWVTAVKVSNFSGHYLRNRSTLDKGVLGYIGIVQHKEHSPEVLSIPPGTPCIVLYESVWKIIANSVKDDKIILHTMKRRKSNVLVTSCVRTAFCDTVLKEWQREGYKLRKDEGEDVDSYWMTFRKGDCTGDWREEELDHTLRRTRRLRN